MGRAKRAIFFALISSLLVTQHAVALVDDETWVVPDEYGQGFFQFAIQDPSSGLLHSQLTGYSDKGTLICKSLDDPFCAGAKDFYYGAIIPICEGDDARDCIRGVEAIDSTGNILSAKFKEYATPNHPNKFTGSAKYLLPDSASPSLWEFESTIHSKGKQMAISVGMSGNYSHFSTQVGRDNFFINLHPVSLQPGPGGFQDPNWFENYHKCIQRFQSGTEKYTVECGQGSVLNSKYTCAFHLNRNGDCWLKHPFPQDLRFQVIIDLAKEPVGWFHGRMKDPEIEISKISNGVQLRVAGQSTKQPIFYWGKKFSEMSPEMQAIWQECLPRQICSSGSRLINSDNETDFNKKNVLFYPLPVGDFLLNFIKPFIPEIDDRSIALRSAWNIRSLSPGEMAKAPRCFNSGSGVAGIVTTNANVYSEGPPSFDGSSLQYQVAAPHYTPRGDEFLGTYNLVMRSTVARCLYGFSNAPIKASIEVFGENGEKTVATTAVGERDGWLYLSAHNFTYSSPVIKAKLSQESVATQTQPLVSNKINSKINCSKAGKIKTISARNLKCPKGWKKI